MQVSHKHAKVKYAINTQGEHATTCKGGTYTNLDSSLLGPKQWPNAMEMRGKTHTSMHMLRPKHLSIKKHLLNTLKGE